jgi:hypothetical protein
MEIMAAVTKIDKTTIPAGRANLAPAKQEPIGVAASLIAALGQPLEGTAERPEKAYTNEAFFPAYLKEAEKERKVWQGLEITFFSAKKEPDFVPIQKHFEHLFSALYNQTSTKLQPGPTAGYFSPEMLKTAIEQLVVELRPLFKSTERFLEIAGKEACAFLKQMPALRFNIKTLFADHINLFTQATKFLYERYGMKEAQKVGFTEADKADFQIKTPSKDAIEMNCFEFAMLKTRQVYARKWIFDYHPVQIEVWEMEKTEEVKKKLRAIDPMCHLPTYFKAWDYCPVVVPEPGDLVVYFNDGYEPKHVAVYESEGMACSKFGSVIDCSYSHPLFHVHSNHGRRFAFFRRMEQTLAMEVPSREAEVDPALRQATKTTRLIEGQEVTLFTSTESELPSLTHWADQILISLREQMRALVTLRASGKSSKNVIYSYPELRLMVIAASRALLITHNLSPTSGREYDLLTKALGMVTTHLDERKTAVAIDPHQFDESFHEDFAPRLVNYCCERLGVKVAEERIAFTEKTLKEFGIQERSWITQNPERMSCVQFALFKSGDVRMKSIIFKALTDLKQDPIKKLPRLLKAFKYESVSAPRKGDLVVYYANDEEQHVGVYLGEGMVESKLGIRSPVSHTHRLFDVQHNYGNTIAFFRRPG